MACNCQTAFRCFPFATERCKLQLRRCLHNILNGSAQCIATPLAARPMTVLKSVMPSVDRPPNVSRTTAQKVTPRSPRHSWVASRPLHSGQLDSSHQQAEHKHHAKGRSLQYPPRSPRHCTCWGRIRHQGAGQVPLRSGWLSQAQTMEPNSFSTSRTRLCRRVMSPFLIHRVACVARGDISFAHLPHCLLMSDIIGAPSQRCTNPELRVSELTAQESSRARHQERVGVFSLNCHQSALINQRAGRH